MQSKTENIQLIDSLKENILATLDQIEHQIDKQVSNTANQNPDQQEQIVSELNNYINILGEILNKGK